MLPENRKGTPAKGAQSENLADEATFNDSDYFALVAEAEKGYVLALFQVPISQVVNLATIPEPGFFQDPLCGMAYLAIVSTFAAGIQPDLVTVAETIRRESIEIPEVLRSRLIPWIAHLAVHAPVPTACQFYRDLVRHYRRAAMVTAAGERLIRAARTLAPEDLPVVSEIVSTDLLAIFAVTK
ncbi:hypothetical protein EH165_09750 [Nakamurella antarctica]|uniref:DnaB-like helicase N terminal domain-containing protein n=1 Tax=Nakamurella antarctica TaxID=1902245 RepID=A0A3G8ZMB0_9ACTN|nr:hypothetical protein [Nakamurella antarctica]AZI58380.1 hypothetical protein EH165_09750 [Nakamurella antarctica]